MLRAHLAGPLRPSELDSLLGWALQSSLRASVAKLWEHEHDVAAAPISPTEIEAAFLLALPLIALPERASGSCSLAVLSARVGAQDRGRPAFAGVEIGLDRGELIFCRPTGNASQQTWALGTIDDWFRAVIDGESGTLRLGGGKPGLARELTEALHATLSEFLAGTRTAS
ncbi:MAG TPA: hypothetical protein VFT19_07520 [Solirubrobacterales bacterium]|nr:hypothetical protein [Solirubrobacterales bacterium]